MDVVSPTQPLVKFLKEHKAENSGEATHFCMNSNYGGKFKILESDHEQFYELYVDALKDGLKMYLTERCVGLRKFKFFLDIDFSYDVLPPDVNDVMPHILAVVPHSEQYVISIRNGYKWHFNFPDCYTTADEAIALSRKIEKALDKDPQLVLTKVTHEKLSWNKVIDESVYGTGLRLLGSLKSSKRGQPENGKYMDLVNTVFEPQNITPPFGYSPSLEDMGTCYYVICKDGFKVSQSGIKYEHMLWTSIRYGIPPLPKEENLVETDESDVDSLTENKIGITDEPSFKSGGGKNLAKSVEDKLRSKLINFITVNYDLDSTDIGSLKVKTKDDKTYLYVQLTSKTCHFKNKDHQRNHQYMMIGVSRTAKLYIMQRCFDSDCKTKQYNRMTLPEELDKMMIPVFQHRAVDGDLEPTIVAQALDCVNDLVHLPEKKMIVPFHVSETETNEKIIKGICPKMPRLCECPSTEMEVTFRQHGLQCKCPKCLETYPYHDGTLVIPCQYIALTQVVINVINPTIIVQQEISDPLYFVKDAFTISNDEDINTTFLRALWGTHSLLAKLLFDLYESRFRVDRPSKPIVWFEFDGNLWKSESETLQNILFDEEHDFIHYFYRALKYYQDLGDDTDRENVKKVAHIQRVIDNLQNNKFQEQVILQCARYWYSRHTDFVSKINVKDICTFTNGVFDFEQVCFRSGEPEDYQTFSTHLEYKEYDENDSNIQFVMSFLQEILPTEGVLEYLLKVLSTCLSNDVSLQMFFMLTGVGGNGKSVLMELLQESLGDYFTIIQSSLITKARESANSANEALSSLRMKRMVVFNEIPKNAVIQADIMKMLSGGDSISTRQNYGRQIVFKPSFKSFLICNTIPELSENGHSEWRRVRVIHFPMKFVSKPNPANPLERKVDPTLKRRLLNKACTTAFLSILIEFYKRYVRDGLETPEAVIEHTRKYQDDNDKWKKFVDSYIAEDEKGVVESKTLVETAEKWWWKNHRCQPPGRNDILEYFTQNVFRGVEKVKMRIPKELRANFEDKTSIYGWKNFTIVDIDAE